MIRRYAAGFRALLMATDALLAVAVLFGLSFWRWGNDWSMWWQYIVPVPQVLLIVYALGWVVAVGAQGLYRPRARWSIRREAMDVLRAAATMGVVTLSVLFLFKLPDVSRLFLLFLFPVQAAVTIATRLALRAFMERIRVRGRNIRYVLVLGAGQRAQAFAAKLENHRELGLRIMGFLHDKPFEPLRSPWKRLGRLDDLETILHTRIVDEVAICLPASQLALVEPITRLCADEGRIVRIPTSESGLTLSGARVEQFDGIRVMSLVYGPDRALALMAKRALDIVLAVLGLVVLSPVFVAVTLVMVIAEGRPVVFRQIRVGLHGRPFSIVKFRTMFTGSEQRRSEV